MSLTRNVVTKLKLVVYDHILSRAVFGYNKKPKSYHDNDFKSGRWDYLASESEKLRYINIITFYREFKPNGSILDIGCGQGVLYKYMSEEFPQLAKSFTGIDISSAAIQMARKEFPDVDFQTMNYDEEKPDQKYDVVIFNETLYYLAWPMKTLKKSFDNLNPDGIVIVSMHDYHGRNNRIWKQIERNYSILASKKEAVNKGKMVWDAKVLRQR